jgi:hypothetical protein
MLGLKSFKTAAVTFAGIELANRIRKRQVSFGRGDPGGARSLMQLWDRALASHSSLDRTQCEPSYAHPPMHQNSRVNVRSKAARLDIEPRRHARKIVDGRGLYLLLTPNGGRYWRYNYRFEGKHKTLALGIHPDISLEKARARHQIAHNSCEWSRSFDKQAHIRQFARRPGLQRIVTTETPKKYDWG